MSSTQQYRSAAQAMPSTTHPPAPGAAAPAILAVLFLAATDTTIVGTLMPQIAGSIGGQALFPWLMSGFMATMALCGPLAGALAARHGVRSVLVWAMLIFLAGSAGAALAPAMPALIAARLLQGAGAGMIIVLSYAALAMLYGPARRGRVQSLVSLVWGAAAIAGPLAGLGVSAAFGWRAAFLLNLPVGLVCLLVLRKQPFGAHAPRGMVIDYVAQACFALCVLGLMVALSASRLGLSRPLLGGLLALAACALAGLLARIRMRPASSPVPLAFFRDRALCVAMLIVVCGSIALYTSITLVPSALHARHAADGAQTGVVVVLAALGFVLGSALCGWRIGVLGYRLPCVGGGAALALGALILALGGRTLGWQAMALAELCIGLGMGCVAVGTLVLTQNKAPSDALASYTSTIQLLRNLGAALGINALSALRFDDAAAGSAADQLGTVFGVLAPLLIACALLALLLPAAYRLRGAPVKVA